MNPIDLCTTMMAHPGGGVFVAAVQESDTAPIQAAAAQLNSRIIPRRLSGKLLRSCAEVLTLIPKALDFPDYYGRNWEALNEILVDRDFKPKAPTLFILEHFDRVLPNQPRDMSILSGILNRVAGGLAESSYRSIIESLPASRLHEHPFEPFWVLLCVASDPAAFARSIPKAIALT